MRRTPRKSAPRPRLGRTGSPASWRRPLTRRGPQSSRREGAFSSSRSRRAAARSQSASRRMAWTAAASAVRAAAARARAVVGW
eukprot:scaffold42839_cov58-Phaeocystis_antarctica.AAC.1